MYSVHYSDSNLLRSSDAQAFRSTYVKLVTGRYVSLIEANEVGDSSIARSVTFGVRAGLLLFQCHMLR